MSTIIFRLNSFRVIDQFNVVHYIGEIFFSSRGEIFKHPDRITFRKHGADEIRANESSASRYKYPFHFWQTSLWMHEISIRN